MAKCIVVSGTPGTGKSTLSRLLADRLGGIYIDLSELVVRENLYSFFDEQTMSYVIDEKRVTSRVREVCTSMRQTVVISTHYPEILDDDIVDKVVVLRLDPRVLVERLKARGWGERKIAENAMAELLSVVAANVYSKFSREKIYEVDTTNRELGEVTEEVLRAISEGLHTENPIDWLARVEPEFIDSLERVLDLEA
ncbi:adenylate kinase family protein [Thermogladius sp. 4427co]|uniref:adenylate kinase family protein n=1 Tax=Thermogladius sp. 4427co TaxID=3450718 RepID=UPI003F796C8A